MTGMDDINIKCAKFQPPPPAIFTGEKRDAMTVYNWLDRVELFHWVYKVQHDQVKLIMAQFYLADEAQRWFRQHKMLQASWDQFKYEFTEHFCSVMMCEKERTKFMRLKQTGLVKRYNDAFNRYVELLGDYYTLPEKFLKLQYLQGLRSDLAASIQPVYETLSQFQTAALQAEIAQLDSAERQRPQSSSALKYENEHTKFVRLKQTGTVREYNDAFNKSLDILTDCYTLPETFLKLHYFQGLRPDLAATIPPLFETLRQYQIRALNVDIFWQHDLKTSSPKTVDTETTSKKGKCIREGLCFTCKQKGHINKFCPEKTEQL